MFWKLIGRHLFYPLSIFLVISLWLFATESGCKTSFWLIKNFLPGDLEITKVEGKWTDKLALENLKYENPTITVTAKKISFEFNLLSLLNAAIEIPFVKLENALYVFKKQSQNPLFIENGEGKFKMTFNHQNLVMDIKTLRGAWFDMPIYAHAKISIIDKHIQTPTGAFILGENKIILGKSTQIQNQFEWTINLNTNKKIKANFQGYLIPDKKQNHWSVQINKADFNTELTGTWVLKTPHNFQFSDRYITLGEFVLQNKEKQQQIKGNFDYNNRGLNANFYLASLFLPKQALNLKDMHFNISGKTIDALSLKGLGYSGTGQFQIEGNIQPNANTKLSLNFKGKNLQIYNTHDIQIIGSPTLALKLNNNALFVDGTLLIHKGIITMQNKKNVGILSRDIVIKNVKNTDIQKNDFRIIPNLYVVIENNLHFDGYGMSAIIGGKLMINERPDGLLSGNGKLTIKEGKYRLQGATRYIHKGHLLFPPGTLLKDPILDILISQNRVEQHATTANTNVGIYVQGTLQHPTYHPYSNDSNLKSADILSRLGFGQNEAAGDENQRQLFAQTAFLFSGTANPFVDFLQKNLQLEEFNLESKPTNKTFYTQGGADTVLVIGKSLSQKLYLQYLQSIMDPVATIRLKYFLSRFFTASAETGTEGVGGDLTFSMEKD